MTHESNREFQEILARLSWSARRCAMALDVETDEVNAWLATRRVPDRVIERMRKFDQIYHGASDLYESHEGPAASRSAPDPPPPSPPTRDLELEAQLFELRAAYQELAQELVETQERCRCNASSSHLTSRTTNPYAALRVAPGAPWSEVKQRFHELSRLYHPDRGGDAEQMKRLSAAYARLRIIYGA